MVKFLPKTPLDAEVMIGSTSTRIRLLEEKYANGRFALVSWVIGEDGELVEPFGVLTVNLPSEPLGPREFFVKTWSENAGWARAALEAFPVLFRDTRNRRPAGFCEAEVWEIVK